MTTDTALPRDRLTDSQRLEIQDFQSTTPGILTPADYWVAAQQAVLQSPEVQKLRSDRDNAVAHARSIISFTVNK